MRNVSVFISDLMSIISHPMQLKYLKNGLTIIIIKIDRNHDVQNSLIDNRKFIPKSLISKFVYKHNFSNILKNIFTTALEDIFMSYLKRLARYNIKTIFIFNRYFILKI